MKANTAKIYREILNAIAQIQDRNESQIIRDYLYETKDEYTLGDLQEIFDCIMAHIKK